MKDLLGESRRLARFGEGGLDLLVLEEGCDEVPASLSAGTVYDVRLAHLSMRFLWEDVLDRPRKATPCFMSPSSFAVVAERIGY